MGIEPVTDRALQELLGQMTSRSGQRRIVMTLMAQLEEKDARIHELEQVLVRAFERVFQEYGKDATQEETVAAVERLIQDVNHFITWFTLEERVAADLDLSYANHVIAELEAKLAGPRNT